MSAIVRRIALIRFRSVCIILSLAIAAILVALSQKIRPSLHSCDVRIPNKASQALSTMHAISQFIRMEGASTLATLFAKAIGFGNFYGSPDIRGKRFLMVGGGQIDEFVDVAQSFGVDLYLLDDPKSFWKAHPYARRFTIDVPDFGRVSATNPESIVATVVELMEAKKLKFDGVFTCVEDNGPLAALLSKRLGLPGSSPEAASIARNKVRVREVMQAAGLRAPRMMRLNSDADVEIAATTMPFPSFLKPVFGVGALFAQQVNSPQHLREVYAKNIAEIDPAQRPIYWHGRDMVLEELITGSEIQLELLLHEGRVVYHCFSSQYSATRDWLVFPSNLTSTQKQQLFELARDTVLAVGLSTGVVHIEMFWTEQGPQLIEINNRISRGFLAINPAHQLLFGEKLADYYGAVLFLALGMPPPLRERQVPVMSIAVFPETPSKTGWETDGLCDVYVGLSPAEALRTGLTDR